MRLLAAAVAFATSVVSALAAVPVLDVPIDENGVRHVITNAHRVAPLPNGALCVMYRSPVADEPSAISMAIVGRSGSVEDYFNAVDWLPDSADAAEGTLGQVQSVAVMPGGAEIAAVVGWRSRDGRGHNGMVILRLVETTWMPVRFIRGLGALPALVPLNDELLAGTSYIRARGTATLGPPKVTIFDTNGCVRAELFYPEQGERTSTGGSRLAADGEVVAFFDDVQARLTMFRVEPGRPCRETVAAMEIEARFPDAAVAKAEITAEFDLKDKNGNAAEPPVVESMKVLSPTSVAVAINNVRGAEDVQTVLAVYKKTMQTETWWSGPFLQASHFTGQALEGFRHEAEGSLFRHSVAVQPAREPTRKRRDILR